MPILEVIEELSRNGRMKRTLRCLCDACERVECFKPWKNRYKLYHFCSRSCSNTAQRPNGLLYKQVVETNLRLFGHEFPTQLSSIMEKQHETNRCRYGADRCTLMRAAFSKKYGVSNPSNVHDVVKRRLLSNIEKYGVPSTFQVDVVKHKIRKTNNSRYGVPFYVQTDRFKSDAYWTNILRFGVGYPMQSHAVRERIDWRAAAEKRHKTMKENGMYGCRMSKPERIMYDHLVGLYGTGVEHQVFVHRWPIDFYIRQTDVYVQVDGVYWHGLDRPIEMIKESKNPRDKNIYKKYLTDRKQEVWFKNNGKTLLRVTDKQIKEEIIWQLI